MTSIFSAVTNGGGSATVNINEVNLVYGKKRRKAAVTAGSQQQRAEGSASVSTLSQYGTALIANNITANTGGIDARVMGSNPYRSLSDVEAKRGNILAAVVDPSTLTRGVAFATESEQKFHRAKGEMKHVRGLAGKINAPVVGRHAASTAVHVHGASGVVLRAVDPTTTSTEEMSRILADTGGNLTPHPFH